LQQKAKQSGRVTGLGERKGRLHDWVFNLSVIFVKSLWNVTIQFLWGTRICRCRNFGVKRQPQGKWGFGKATIEGKAARGVWEATGFQTPSVNESNFSGKIAFRCRADTANDSSQSPARFADPIFWIGRPAASIADWSA